MPIISVSVSKQNHAWLKNFNSQVERKSTFKVGASKIIDTMILLAKGDESALEKYLIERRVNEIKNKALKRYASDVKKVGKFI